MAVEIQKLEDLTSSKSLTKERFFAAVKLARVMLSSAREQELQEFYRGLIRVDFSTESKQGQVTFYLPLPCEEFRLESPRISFGRSAPTLYYPRVSVLMQIRFELKDLAA